MRSYLVALLLIISVSLINGDCDGPNCEKQCEWRGSAPVCVGACEEGEHKVKEAATAAEAKPYDETFGKECWYGKKFYCCKRNETMDDADSNRVLTRFGDKN